MHLNDELKAELKLRNPELLTVLFNDLNPYLLRVLSAKGIYGNHADDIICETWVTFLEKIDAFEGRSSVKTYLTGILFLKMKEQFRVQKKWQPEEDLSQFLDDQFTESGMWKIRPEDPSDIFHKKEISDLINKCMEGLSDSQREAFTLKEIENESTDEICKILNINISNLGVLVFRAKDKLKKCLKGNHLNFGGN